MLQGVPESLVVRAGPSSPSLSSRPFVTGQLPDVLTTLCTQACSNRTRSRPCRSRSSPGTSSGSSGSTRVSSRSRACRLSPPRARVKLFRHGCRASRASSSAGQMEKRASWMRSSAVAHVPALPAPREKTCCSVRAAKRDRESESQFSTSDARAEAKERPADNLRRSPSSRRSSFALSPAHSSRRARTSSKHPARCSPPRTAQ